MGIDAVNGRKKTRGAPRKRPEDRGKVVTIWLSSEVFQMCANAGEGVASRGARLILNSVEKQAKDDAAKRG